MRILNLYSGVLGTVFLFNDKEHEITNVEWNPKIMEAAQKLKPNHRFFLKDAHQYLLDHYDEYDFVLSSPPCQYETKMMKFTRHKLRRYPTLTMYQEILFLRHFFKGKWVVENVVPYYEPLIKPTAKIGRHLFWANFDIPPMENEPAQPKNFINEATVKGSEMMKEWLGIKYDGNIYYEGNHCPAQVLRNCVHPKIGLHILNHAA